MKRLGILFLFLAFFSCSKPDEIAPVISVISPQENQTFSDGQTVTIKATASDNEGLHMIHAIVVDNTGGHWVHLEEHIDGKTFDINKTFSITAGKIFTITIDATDHNDNTTKKEITVTAN
jgi:hypothetical protein